MVGHGHNFLRMVTILIVAVVVAAGHVMLAAGQGDGSTNVYFGSKPLYHIEITLRLAEVESLRISPRKYVKASIRSEGAVYPEVGLRLKGSTGSFRPVDDKPGFTLEFDRFGTNRLFENQTKIHLNNSVEDPSFLSEQVGGEYFRAVGIPVPRVAHALVMLNGRSLGLYVLVEGLTPAFYGQYFARAYGSTFEKDIDQNEAPTEKQLLPLASVMAESDLDRRWRLFGEVLDRDQFISFLAIETAIVHRDGYGTARNNFRMYAEPEAGRFTFLPHGMDQLFAPSDFPTEPQMAGTVARSILSIPEGQAGYSRKVRETAAMLSVGTNRVHQLAEQLRPYLSRQLWHEVSTGSDQLALRIAARARWLELELSRPALRPLEFSGRPILVAESFVSDKAGGGFAVATNLNSGVCALKLLTRNRSTPSWRAQVLLKPGRYRLEGRVKTEAVKELPFGNHSGVAFRILGTPFESKWLTGNSEWQDLIVDFQVQDSTQSVGLVFEMRASSGEAFVDCKSLQLNLLQ